MKTIKLKMKKRIAVLSAFALLAGLVTTAQVNSAVVQAAESNTPSVTAYATVDDLRNKFTPNEDGTPSNIGKLVFGKDDSGNALEWYILGEDTGVAGENTAIFTTSMISTQKYSLTDGDRAYNYEAGTGYGDAAGSISVYVNHYGASDLRKALQSLADNTAYFSQAEQNLMNKTTVTNKDQKNNTDYTTSDKLYILQGVECDGYYKIYAGSKDDKALLMSSWTNTEQFYLRSPSSSPSYTQTHVLGVFNTNYVSSTTFLAKGLTIPVRPASNLNLSSVIFSSAAIAASSDVISGTIVDGTAMTLRLDGSAKTIGNVQYNATSGNVTAQKAADAAGTVSLVVQGREGERDWYYSMAVTETDSGTEVTAGQIKEALSLGSVPILADCKIWLEITDADGMIYAKTAEEQSETSITSLELTGMKLTAATAFHTTASCATAGIDVDTLAITYTTEVGGSDVEVTEATADWNKTYKASVTLRVAAPDYVFADSVVVTIDGEPAGNFPPNEDGTLTVTSEFTTAKRKITNVTVPTVPVGNTFTDYYTASDVLSNGELGTQAGIIFEGALEPASDNMYVTWTLANGTYNAIPEAENTFIWTVPSSALDNYNAADCEGYDGETSTITGRVTIKNKAASPVTITGTDTGIDFTGEDIDVSQFFTIDSNAGAADYSLIAGGTGVGRLNGTLLTVTQTGTFKIMVTTAAVGNYKAGKAYITLTVRNGAIRYNAADYSGVYDGQPHSIAVTVTAPAGAAITYSIDGINYSTEKPMFVDASDNVHTVYYRIMANGYEPSNGSATVTINQKPVTAVVTVSDKTYDGTATAEVTATVDIGITGQTLTVTGLTGTFDSKNAGKGRTVTIDSTNAVVTGGTDTNAGNYSITYPAAVADISPAEITVKAADIEKNVGDPDPEFTYTITSGKLAEGETLSGISYSREEGETVGEYVITVTETPGANPNYNLTLQNGKLKISKHTWDAGTVTKQPTCADKGTIKYICTECGEEREEDIEALGHDWGGEWKVVKEATATEEGKAEKECARGCGEKQEKAIPVLGHTHTVVTDEAVAATCTTTGLTEGNHCSACGEVIVAQQTIDALGHDWSGEWKVVKEATATEDGKRETYCTRGCGQKKVEVIPAIGSEDEGDTNGGAIQKDAEVAKDAPINEATLDNKKSELLNAVKIFTAEEKLSIENGKDARVWLEVTRTDENSIAPEDKVEVKKAAEEIMGENPDITYFDADLFKQVEGSEKTQLHEPGIDINVTIKIPDELLNHDSTMVREYKIIRLHKDAATGDSNVEVLGGSFNAATGEFTFATDKFSTYAIAYNDVPVEDSTIIPVTGVVMSSEGAAITGVGETVQLTVAVSPLLATDRSVSWVSSDTGVATVDATGKVTAVGNGTCTITATTNDGHFSVVCTVTVNIQSDNGNDVSDGNGNTGNSESGSTDSGSTAGNGTGSSESGSTGVDESGSGNAGNTGNTGTDVNTGDGQITAPSTGGEGASGRMVPIAVFMMLALAGIAAVAAAYPRKKRTER